MTAPNQRDRALELLCDRALGPLDSREQIELAQLLIAHRDLGPEMFDEAASAIALAGIGGRLEPMPAHLVARLESQTGSVVASAPAAATVLMADRPLPPARDVVVPIERGRRGVHPAVAVTGWLLAAACVLLAVGIVKRRPDLVGLAPVAPAPAAMTAERETLLARAGTAKLEWTSTGDPAAKEASGDVVWSATEQRGYMRFRGLARNDPKVSQYQLWIFDKNREQEHPVDGGVFDVDKETGDVLVPIRAKLAVGEPVLFAVTVERPGGVVVSKRERIVVTAKPATG